MRPFETAAPETTPQRDYNPADCRRCTHWNDVGGECLLDEAERFRLCGVRPASMRRQPDWLLFDPAERKR